LHRSGRKVFHVRHDSRFLQLLKFHSLILLIILAIANRRTIHPPDPCQDLEDIHQEDRCQTSTTTALRSSSKDSNLPMICLIVVRHLKLQDQVQDLGEAVLCLPELPLLMSLRCGDLSMMQDKVRVDKDLLVHSALISTVVH
jgi:uncharacterized membrane protein